MASRHFAHARIMVAEVLEQVEGVMAWEAIIEEWRYESDKRCDRQKPVRMAREAPAAYAPELVLEAVIT